MTGKPNSFERWLARAGSMILAICTVYGVAKDIIQHPLNVPGATGFLRLNAVLILGVFTAIAFGVIWQAFEKIFGWKYGAGGHGRLPRGWSAISSCCATRSSRLTRLGMSRSPAASAACSRDSICWSAGRHLWVSITVYYR